MNILTGNSIRQRFILTLGSIVVLIFMVFSAAIIYQNVSTIESQLKNRLQDASKLAQKILPNALWQYNNDYVADFIDSLFLYEDIIFVKVVSGDVAIKEKSRSDFFEKSFLSFQNSSRFSTQESSISFDGKVIGKIQIAITRERIKKTIFLNSILTIMFVILIISAIISIIYFNSKRYIFAPLSRLENSAAEISKGNWDADIDISGNDEIGNLSKTFHQMIKNLKATTASRVELEIEIKERKQTEKQRDKLISDLKTALAEVKTLSGMLPICASCKKIRDDKGYWNQIEGYIQKYSEAEFSHGMCPECSDKLYGKEDWYIEMKNEEN